MNGSMDEWASEWMAVWVSGWMAIWVSGWMAEWTDGSGGGRIERDVSILVRNRKRRIRATKQAIRGQFSEGQRPTLSRQGFR